jgi:thioredoxin 1
MFGKVIFGAAIGVVAGYLIGYAGKSSGAACPILCNPTVSAVLFGVAGALITMGVARRGSSEIVMENLTPVENADQFRELVLDSEKTSLVEFYTHWCSVCRRMAPVVNSLAKEHAGKANFVKVDVDKAVGLAQEYGVEGVPTIVFFARGKEGKRIVGATWKAELQKELDSALAG